LETDFDANDEGQKADKLTVQGAIKITDQVVAEKEQEIQELRRLLENQSQQVGDVAVGAAAVAEMLDTDELIRQERESLKRLQDQLREQLRQAEVDISVERAKLARERAELDEKLRSLESEKANLPSGGDGSGDKGKKGGGRKWLTRLGLGDGKEG
jgi:DNA repair ATPase RecN